MNGQLPKVVQRLVKRLEFLAVPNLALLIAGLGVLGFAAENLLGTPMERFTFDPALVLQGDLVRLFAFPFVGGHLIFVVFFVFYVYAVMGGLQTEWGNAPLTVFVLLGYVAVVVGALLTMQHVEIWHYVLLNVTFAFGTLFPNVQFMLIVIPVKAKWISILAAVFFLLQFVAGSIAFKLFCVFALAPYLLFFGPQLVHSFRTHRQVRRNRSRFKDDMWK